MIDEANRVLKSSFIVSERKHSSPNSKFGQKLIWQDKKPSSIRRLSFDQK